MQANIDLQGSQKGNDFNFGLKWKEGRVVSIGPDASLKEAARLMKENQVGTVLVMDGENRGEPQGIVTDRDIALCFANGDQIEDLVVSDIMSDTVICANEKDDILKFVALMHENGVSRIPLKNASGNIIGVVTSKNILEILVKSLFDLTQISEQQQRNEQSH